MLEVTSIYEGKIWAHRNIMLLFFRNIQLWAYTAGSTPRPSHWSYPWKWGELWLTNGSAIMSKLCMHKYSWKEFFPDSVSQTQFWALILIESKTPKMPLSYRKLSKHFNKSSRCSSWGKWTDPSVALKDGSLISKWCLIIIIILKNQTSPLSKVMGTFYWVLKHLQTSFENGSVREFLLTHSENTGYPLYNRMSVFTTLTYIQHICKKQELSDCLIIRRQTTEPIWMTHGFFSLTLCKTFY